MSACFHYIKIDVLFHLPYQPRRLTFGIIVKKQLSTLFYTPFIQRHVYVFLISNGNLLIQKYLESHSGAKNKVNLINQVHHGYVWLMFGKSLLWERTVCVTCSVVIISGESLSLGILQYWDSGRITVVQQPLHASL